jgi:hypothetical protein
MAALRARTWHKQFQGQCLARWPRFRSLTNKVFAFNGGLGWFPLHCRPFQRARSLQVEPLQ